MFRATTLAIVGLTATLAVGQTIKDLRGPPAGGHEAGAPTTTIPDIPAGEDPMSRRPDPAEDTPAAKAPPQPEAGDRNATCRVRRADTDTGFVVVCEEDG